MALAWLNEYSIDTHSRANERITAQNAVEFFTKMQKEYGTMFNEATTIDQKNQIAKDFNTKLNHHTFQRDSIMGGKKQQLDNAITKLSESTASLQDKEDLNRIMSEILKLEDIEINEVVQSVRAETSALEREAQISSRETTSQRRQERREIKRAIQSWPERDMEIRRHETTGIGRDHYSTDYNRSWDNIKVGEVESTIDWDNDIYQSQQIAIQQISDLNGDGYLLFGGKKEIKKDGVDWKDARKKWNNTMLDWLTDDERKEAENSERWWSTNDQLIYQSLNQALARWWYNEQSSKYLAQNISKMMTDTQTDLTTENWQSFYRIWNIKVPEDVYNEFAKYIDWDKNINELAYLMHEDTEIGNRCRFYFHRVCTQKINESQDLPDMFLTWNSKKFAEKQEEIEASNNLYGQESMLSKRELQQQVEKRVEAWYLTSPDWKTTHKIDPQFERIYRKYSETGQADFITNLISALDNATIWYSRYDGATTDAQSLSAVKSFRLFDITKDIACTGGAGLGLWKTQDNITWVSQSWLNAYLNAGIWWEHNFGDYDKNNFRRNVWVWATIHKAGWDRILNLSLSANLEAKAQLNLKNLLESWPNQKKYTATDVSIWAGASIGVNFEAPISVDAYVGVERDSVKWIEQVTKVYKEISMNLFNSAISITDWMTAEQIKASLSPDNFQKRINDLASTTKNEYHKVFLSSPERQAKLLGDFNTIINDRNQVWDYGLKDSSGNIIQNSTFFDVIANSQDPSKMATGTMLLQQEWTINVRHDEKITNISGSRWRAGAKLWVVQWAMIVWWIVALAVAGPIWRIWLAAGAKFMITTFTSFKRYSNIYQENLADMMWDREVRENLIWRHQINTIETWQTWLINKVNTMNNMFLADWIKFELVDWKIVVWYKKPNDNQNTPGTLYQALNIQYNPNYAKCINYNDDKNELTIWSADGKTPDLTSWVELGQQTKSNFLYIGEKPSNGERSGITYANKWDLYPNTPGNLEDIDPMNGLETEDFDKARWDMKTRLLGWITDAADKTNIETALSWIRSQIQLTIDNWLITNVSHSGIDLKAWWRSILDIIKGWEWIKIDFTLDKNWKIIDIPELWILRDQQVEVSCKVEGINETQENISSIKLNEDYLSNNPTLNDIRTLIRPFQYDETGTSTPNQFVYYLASQESYSSNTQLKYREFLDLSKKLDDGSSNNEINVNDYEAATKKLQEMFRSLSDPSQSQLEDFKNSINAVLDLSDVDQKTQAMIYLCNRMKTIFAGRDLWPSANATITQRGNVYQTLESPWWKTMWEFDQLVSARSDAINKRKTEDPNTEIWKVQSLNGCGLTAWYRNQMGSWANATDNRWFSMTAIWDTYYEERFMTKFSEGSDWYQQAKDFYLPTIEASPADAEMIWAILLEKINATLTNDITWKLSPKQVYALLNWQTLDEKIDEENWNKADLHWNKIKLNIDRCFYLLWECRNESVWRDLKSISVSWWGGNVEATWTDPLEQTSDGMSLYTGYTTISSSVNGQSSQVWVSANYGRERQTETWRWETSQQNNWWNWRWSSSQESGSNQSWSSQENSWEWSTSQWNNGNGGLVWE